VANDDQAIGRMAAEHLLERGFANFGFVGIRRGWGARQRHQGFAETLERAKRDCNVFTFDPATEDRASALAHWLAELDKPVALMAYNDLVARELIDIALANNLAVPQDVAVLGVDDDRWLTHLGSVSLSSIENNFWEIGYQAAKMLDEMMAGQVHDPPQWIPPRRVVVRQSTDVTLTDDPKTRKALNFIHEHLAEGINVKDVIAHVGMTRTSVETKIKRATGLTPLNAICRARVDRAKQLLTQTDQSITKIAKACGFATTSQLVVVFKRLTGMTPGQYRRQRVRSENN